MRGVTLDDLSLAVSREAPQSVWEALMMRWCRSVGDARVGEEVEVFCMDSEALNVVFGWCGGRYRKLELEFLKGGTMRVGLPMHRWILHRPWEWLKRVGQRCELQMDAEASAEEERELLLLNKDLPIHAFVRLQDMAFVTSPGCTFPEMERLDLRFYKGGDGVAQEMRTFVDAAAANLRVLGLNFFSMSCAWDLGDWLYYSPSFSNLQRLELCGSREDSFPANSLLEIVPALPSLRTLHIHGYPLRLKALATALSGPLSGVRELSLRSSTSMDEEAWVSSWTHFEDEEEWEEAMQKARSEKQLTMRDVWLVSNVTSIIEWPFTIRVTLALEQGPLPKVEKINMVLHKDDEAKLARALNHKHLPSLQELTLTLQYNPNPTTFLRALALRPPPHFRAFHLKSGEGLLPSLPPIAAALSPLPPLLSQLSIPCHTQDSIATLIHLLSSSWLQLTRLHLEVGDEWARHLIVAINSHPPSPPAILAPNLRHLSFDQEMSQLAPPTPAEAQALKAALAPRHCAFPHLKRVEVKGQPSSSKGWEWVTSFGSQALTSASRTAKGYSV